MKNSITIFCYSLCISLLWIAVESKTDCEIIRGWLGDNWLQTNANSYYQQCKSAPNSNIETLQVLKLTSRDLSSLPINRTLPQDLWELRCYDIQFSDSSLTGSLPIVINENHTLRTFGFIPQLLNWSYTGIH